MAEIGQVCRRPVFSRFRSAALSNKVGAAVPGVVTSRVANREKSKSIKVVCDQVIFID